MLTLTREEARGLFDLIASLSGHSPENVFCWDGTDDPNDPAISACAKLYAAVGARVPDNLAAVGVR